MCIRDRQEIAHAPIEPAAEPLIPVSAPPVEAPNTPVPSAARADFTPTPIPQAPAVVPMSSDGFAQLEKQLRGEIPSPRSDIPRRVEVPPPSVPPPPPVEIPPQRLSPAAPPGSTPKLDMYGRVVPPRPPSVARPVPPPLVVVPKPPGPPLRDRMMRLLNIEEVLGTNYLGKLGVIILVIGVAGLVG